LPVLQQADICTYIYVFLFINIHPHTPGPFAMQILRSGWFEPSQTTLLSLLVVMFHPWEQCQYPP